MRRNRRTVSKPERAGSTLRGLGGRADIEKCAKAAIAADMFVDMSDDEMIFGYQKQMMRQWLAKFMMDKTLKDGREIRARGAFNITVAKNGQVLNQYVLFDLMSASEIAQVIQRYRNLAETYKAIANKLEVIVEEQMEIWPETAN